ncbi:hypothetical protein SCA6_005938 [Theobroma cacao]
MFEHGGNVNAIDNNKQTALQWAAVRGSIAVADVLLLNGARVEATDIHGYWAVHVAARYGQTAFLNHIVAKYHADYDAPDKDGSLMQLGPIAIVWWTSFAVGTFLILDAVVLIAATTLTTVQASQIARNITTNELSNAICYGYLHGPDGQFMNPYNHGCQKNCTDFLIRGYRDDEVARPPLQRVAS